MTEINRRQGTLPASGPPGETLAPSRVSLRRGDLLGRYQLLCEVARGGMGEVWAARETGRLGLPRLVAIKIPLLDQHASSGDFEQSLFDEARVAASIDHPNVCKVLELSRARGYLFLAMEWIQGVSLASLLAALGPTHRMDFGLAAYLTAQACSGLHAAHELRDDEGVSLEVVHRDATPQNLLVGANGDVKVVDFGIAKARNQRRQVTEAGAIKGKLSYLAPEQLAGKPVDRRADIYMLGCVLYLTTTGQMAFESHDAARTLMQISQGDRPAPSTHVANYPERLEAIVNRAMALDPDKRFRTADDMRIALEAFVDEQPRAVAREDLAALVTRHCGKAIEARRAEVRAAQRAFDTDVSPVAPAEKRGENAVPLRPRPKAPPFPDVNRKDSAAVHVSEGRAGATPETEARAPVRPQSPPTPEAANIVAQVPGTLGCSVVDHQGLVLRQHGETKNIERALSAVPLLAEQLSAIAALFGFGPLSTITTKTANATLLSVYQPHHVLVVEVDAAHPLKNIELALKSRDFCSEREWSLSDKDIEYVEPEARSTAPALPPQRVRDDARGAPALKRAIAGKSPVPSLTDAWTEVRRTLIKGQLSSAQQAVARIQLSTGSENTQSSLEAAQVLQPLIEAIANILAGDNQAGLKKLEWVVSTALTSPSFKWAAQVWSARASVNTVDGLEAAQVYAESSLRLAERLDIEARAVSTLVVAEVANQAREWPRALALTANARALFTELGDKQELAACWLLEARCLCALGRNEESVLAAQRAQECRPSWPPPVTLLVKQALATDRLSEAERALQALLAQRPIAAEAERDRRLLEHVRAGVLPASIAGAYLELLDARADAQSIRQLENLTAKYPRVAQFLETLGWKLLRVGNSERAKTVFERLSARGDLSDDLRASVLLGLGCVATTEKADEHPSAKLRAAVNAAPKHSTQLKAAPPVGPAPGPASAAPSQRPRPADPVDFRVRNTAAPPAPSGPASLAELTAQRKGLGGPVFSGSLELFALPDLLEFMRAGRRTGTLICSSATGIGAVHLRSGNVTGAAAPQTRGLVEHLVLRNFLTREQVRTLLPLHEESKTEALLGTELVRRQVITSTQLREALRDQILAALTDLVSWSEGQFAFNSEPGEGLDQKGPDIEFDAQALLLELYKEMDESASTAK